MNTFARIAKLNVERHKYIENKFLPVDNTKGTREMCFFLFVYIFCPFGVTVSPVPLSSPLPPSPPLRYVSAYIHCVQCLCTVSLFHVNSFSKFLSVCLSMMHNPIFSHQHCKANHWMRTQNENSNLARVSLAQLPYRAFASKGIHISVGIYVSLLRCVIAHVELNGSGVASDLQPKSVLPTITPCVPILHVMCASGHGSVCIKTIFAIEQHSVSPVSSIDTVRCESLSTTSFYNEHNRTHRI